MRSESDSYTLARDGRTRCVHTAGTAGAGGLTCDVGKYWSEGLGNQAKGARCVAVAPLQRLWSGTPGEVMS